MSAFHTPSTHQLDELLIAAEQPKYRQTNLVRRITMGLNRVHSEVLASKKFGKSSLSTASHFSKEGQLIIGRSFPVLDKRYTLSESVGQGTFSQIFKAKDSFTDKEVAIKIMKAGYNVLAVREQLCLSHYATKTRIGSRCCECVARYPSKSDVHKFVLFLVSSV